MCGCWSRAVDANLAQEPLGAQRGGQLGTQDLERHVAVVLPVVRQVDGRHASTADLAIDFVAARESDPQPVNLFHYGGTHGARLPAAGSTAADPWMGDQPKVSSPP